MKRARPAAFTSLATYSKMKGASKLVTAKTPTKRDTDSCFSEILEATLDSVFCLDEPVTSPSAKSRMSAASSTKKSVEASEESEEEAEPVAKVAKRPASALLPVRVKRSAELIANIEAGAIKGSPSTKEEATLVAGRRRELKLLSKDALQELALSKELEKGKKEDMMEAVLAHEAKAREELRAREGQAKQVHTDKKREFEAQSGAQLKALCIKKRLKLGGSKQAVVKRILAKWKEEGGVQEALLVMSRKARRNQLATLDKKALFHLCHKRSIDALVKEVMVERLLSYEIIKGI